MYIYPGQLGILDDRSGAVEAHPGSLEAQTRAGEAQLWDDDAHPVLVAFTVGSKSLL